MKRVLVDHKSVKGTVEPLETFINYKIFILKPYHALSSYYININNFTWNNMFRKSSGGVYSVRSGTGIGSSLS